MLALMTAAALSLIPHTLEPHDNYRLVGNTGSQAAQLDGVSRPERGRFERDCKPTHGITVCANQANAQLRWRITSNEIGPQDKAAGQHVSALRTQHLHCANPVEDGLRCVKPTPAKSFVLGN